MRRKTNTVINSNRRMFVVMLVNAMLRRFGKSLMAIIAALVGSATLFCLTAICLSVPEQIHEDLRAYGANMVVTPRDSFKGIDSSQVVKVTKMLENYGSLTFADYRYENVRIHSLPYVIAGIHVDQVKALNHHWEVSGSWPSEHNVLVGRNVADKLGVSIGSRIKIGYRSSDNGRNLASEGSSTAGSARVIPVPEGGGHKHVHHHHHGFDKPRTNNTNSHLLDMLKSKKTHNEHAMKDMGSSAHTMHDKDNAHAGNATDNHVNHHTSDNNDHSDHADHAASDTSSHTHSHAPKQSELKGLDGRTSTNILQNTGTEFRVSGIVDTGGNEDELVYATLDDVTHLAKNTRGSDVIEYSLNADAAQLKKAVFAVDSDHQLALQAQQVTKVTSADTRIITMLQTLFWIVSAVVLLLTLVGVSTTIFSIVASRRNEIGLRKALGASSESIAHEFFAASALYGLVGGIIGTIIGYICAYQLCVAVFHRNIGAHPFLVIVSVLVSIAISVVASVPPVRVATSINPAIVLREE